MKTLLLLQCAVTALAAFVCNVAVAQDLSIEFESVTPTDLNLRVTGPDGEPVIVEVSDDLIHWEELNRGDLPTPD